MKTISLDFSRFPGTWNALKPAHIRAYARLFLMQASRLFTVDGKETVIADMPGFIASYLELVKVIIEGKESRKNKAFAHLSAWQAQQIYQKWNLLDFLFKASSLTLNPFPRLVIWKGIRPYIFFAPAGDIRHSITADEFNFADTWYTRYKNTGEVKYLDNLIAVIYRPGRLWFNSKNPANKADRRQPFSNKTVDWRIPLIASLPFDIKLSIVLWYEGCRSMIKDRCPSLFSGENEDSASKHGWNDVFVSHAGAELGTVEDIKRMQFSELTMCLEIRIRNNKAIIKKLKNKR